MDTGQTPLAELSEVAESAARTAGAVALRGFRGDVQVRSKGGKDIVTQFDTAAEEAAIGVIRARFPDHEVLAEESGSGTTDHISARYLWTVDPIDGTHNYAMQLPFWCTSVAVTDVHMGQVVAGAVCDPVHDELFSATRGGGAQLNGVA